MAKRYSIFTVISISIITAVVVAATVVWTGNIRKGYSVDIVGGQKKVDTRPAAWFRAEPKSFADLAEKVGKSVVNISTSKKVRGGFGGQQFPRFGPRDPFDNFFDRFFEGMPDAPRERMSKSLGSGFIIDANGTILTNNHVVAGADDIEVGLSDGRTFKAKVLGIDERSDIAVIKIKNDKNLPFARLGSSKAMRPGDWVMAIGNPFGLEHTVTVGVVSAKGRLIGGGAPYAKFIQTDASINPGNSGGPLFNLKGEVIGINTMIHAGGQGIGFAIPIDLAKKEIPELIEKGSVSRGWLGVAIQEVTPELAKSFGLKKTEGALIAEVYSGSPAEAAGLKRGDVMLEYDGERIEEPLDISLHIGHTKPGKKSKIMVLRKGEQKTFDVEIGKYKESKEAFRQPAIGRGKADNLGLIVTSITPDKARQLGITANFKGVLVKRVEPDSAASYANVRTDDLILEINDQKVQTIEAYEGVVDKLKKGDPVRLFIKRGSASIYVAFKL
ncbi:MAG: DegQ family serine endoprotease [Deltaproteobacteria bacterium]|jgi:serine protease Do|nr:DegQ family serine endoprotease [Deltaproteobacteria bacterium]